MKTIDFLSYLRSLDINLWAEGDNLRYRAPKGTLTSDLFAELAERKAEILEFLNQANRQARSNLPPILPVSRDNDLPLSFAQQRLWFLDQLEGGRATYNMYAAMRLLGGLNVAALACSLTALVQRHEALRTTFPTVQGVPVQVIAPRKEVPLPVVDLQMVPSEAQEMEMYRVATAEVQHPFALAQDALLRVMLLQLREQEHVLLVTMHHIVSDGWSVGVAIREVVTLYDACCRGEIASLPSLPIQYADFAHWQRTWLRGEVLERQLAYWREQLMGAPAVLALPT